MIQILFEWLLKVQTQDKMRLINPNRKFPYTYTCEVCIWDSICWSIAVLFYILVMYSIQFLLFLLSDREKEFPFVWATKYEQEKTDSGVYTYMKSDNNYNASISNTWRAGFRPIAQNRMELLHFMMLYLALIGEPAGMEEPPQDYDCDAWKFYPQ